MWFLKPQECFDLLTTTPLKYELATTLVSILCDMICVLIIVDKFSVEAHERARFQRWSEHSPVGRRSAAFSSPPQEAVRYHCACFWCTPLIFLSLIFLSTRYCMIVSQSTVGI